MGIFLEREERFVNEARWLLYLIELFCPKRKFLETNHFKCYSMVWASFICKVAVSYWSLLLWIWCVVVEITFCETCLRNTLFNFMGYCCYLFLEEYLLHVLSSPFIWRLERRKKVILLFFYPSLYTTLLSLLFPPSLFCFSLLIWIFILCIEKEVRILCCVALFYMRGGSDVCKQIVDIVEVCAFVLASCIT